ncbi:TonB-dependent receptor [Oceanicoccus sp. KOV_DT_Chl]|uniref:TonB-dependent receptor n=1 Tax=Oceanicoccus sp. KOV_DT_Chl TaxID=1904639 RepID=UPI0011AF567D|nr:TonB-dependent receptor [Oceanicoccus sp. KOV_DT_Chl]
MRKSNTVLAAAMALTSIGYTGTALAQIQNQAFATLEEIIVTANRRQEMLQDVPMSISAFNENFFKDAGVTDFKSLENYAASLKIVSNTSSRDTSIRIRGIGSAGSNAGIDPSVGVFIDGVYQGRAGMSLGDFMDIERVEVLRGPQGTLYGKNTAAGAISIISKAPVGDFEGSAEVVVGNYDNVETRGMLNVPLNDSGSAIRISAYKVERDGFDENIAADAPQKELNNADKWGIKARALFETEKMGSFTLSVDKSKDTSICCAPDIISYDGSSNLNLSFADLSTVGIPIPDADPYDRKLYADREYTNEVDVEGVSLEWVKDLDNDFILTWINAYRTYDSYSAFDADFSYYDAGAGTTDVDHEQRSSEFRVASPEGETIDYQVGVYYYYSEMDTVGTISMLSDASQAALNTGNVLSGFYNLGGDPPVFLDVSGISPSFFDPVTGTAVNTDTNTHTTTNYAAFGQATWNVSDTFTATLGLRYTYEKKEREGSQITDPAPSTSAGPFGPDIRTDESKSGENVSPTLTFRYYPTEDGRLMYYANIARGFKSGGFNQQRTASPEDNYFDDETSTNYELGWKGTYLDSRLQFNGSIFFVDYEDFQAQSFDGASIAVRNAGSLESYGVELDLQYVPTINWSLAGLWVIPRPSTRSSKALNVQLRSHVPSTMRRLPVCHLLIFCSVGSSFQSGVPRIWKDKSWIARQN